MSHTSVSIRRRLLLLASLAGGFAGCADDGSAENEARSSALLGATADTTHDAVMAYIFGAKCSAVVVHVAGNTGYALTAADCTTGALGELRQGDDHANGVFDVSYPVVAKEVHPRYGDLPEFNVAILKFSGATAATPVLPILPAQMDTIAAGEMVTLVGYGVTETGANTLRREVTMPVESAGAIQLRFNQQNGEGICTGDSGGPVMWSTGGTEYVAALHSKVTDASCQQFGIAVRISGLWEEFVEPYVNGTGYLSASCDRCLDAAVLGPCQASADDCLSDVDCSAYLACVSACTTDACESGCALTEADGYASYTAGVFTCQCDTNCADECATDAACQAAPTCLLPHDEPTCESCYETACCDTAKSCAANEVCRACTGDPTGVECASNTEFAALQSCFESSCATCPVQSYDEPDMGVADMGASDMGTAPEDMGASAGDAGTSDVPDMATAAGDAGGSSLEPPSSSGGTESDGCASSSNGSPTGPGLVLAALFALISSARRI